MLNSEKKDPKKESEYLDKIYLEEDNLGCSPSEKGLWSSDYAYEPVNVIRFIEEDKFLGSMTRELSSTWKEILEEVFWPKSKIITLILTGAIGIGKTTVAHLAILYKMYRMLCLRDPAAYYGLLPGSRIVFGCFNITLNKAEIRYDLVKDWVDGSPWFKNVMPRKLRPDEPIYWPQKGIVYQIGSLAEHALGDNMFGFVLDEANFFKRSPDPNQKGRAHQLFNQASMRLVSRYMDQGSIPGLMILMSSKKMESSFLEEQIAKATTDENFSKTTKVVSMSIWEAKPDKYSKKHFTVALGNESIDSTIMEEDEVVSDRKTLDVPVELRQFFEDDIDQALMDLGGVSTVGSFSFFTNRRAIIDSVDDTRGHPFNVTEVKDVGINVLNVEASTGGQISDHLDLNALFLISGSMRKARVDPGANRFAHVDLAVTHDAAGLAIGHTTWIRGLSYIYFDIVLRIRNPRGEEINLFSVVEFMCFLRSQGWRFGNITFDQALSRMAIQELLKRGFKSAQLSLKLDHYSMFRTVLNMGRINMYRYEPLIEEMFDLKKGEGDDRPNHPLGGSDDVCDAACGVVAHCGGGIQKLIAPKKVDVGISEMPLIMIG